MEIPGKSRARDFSFSPEIPTLHKNEDDQIKITVLPPTNATGNMTDKDSGDGDGFGTINNLTGSMLLASAKLDHERSTTSEDDDEPAEKKPKKKPKNQSKTG